MHVSELSWKHIDHPSEVVEVGQEVTVEVLDVDLDRERVSLSLKATQEDPWRQFARTHAIGQIVPGKVTKLVPFGAFVRVEEGIEGLVHISELAERHVEIPEQVVQVGDDCMVKVIDIDLERRRISLSLKQANEGMTVDTEFDPTRYGMAAEYDTRATTSTPRASTPRPASGRRASRSSARSGRSSTPRRTPATSSTSRSCARPPRPSAEAAADGGGATNYSSQGGGAPAEPAARWPATSSSRRCGRSCPAAPEPPSLDRNGPFVAQQRRAARSSCSLRRAVRPLYETAPRVLPCVGDGGSRAP